MDQYSIRVIYGCYEVRKRDAVSNYEMTMGTYYTLDEALRAAQGHACKPLVLPLICVDY